VAQSFKQDGNKVTVYLNSYENLLGPNTIRKFYIKAAKQGNSLEPSNFTVDKFRGNIPYPEFNKLPVAWKPNNKQLEIKDLIDNTKDYYDTTVKPQDNKFVVYKEPHKTQFILGLPKKVDYPVNGVKGLRMYMPSKYLAMGLAFDYEFFKINPSYLCALSTKENFTCGIVPQESGYTENPVQVEGKTWYWPIQIKHPDGPFQQEAGNFNECKGQYPDYLPASAKHEDYTQLNDGKETDTKWVRVAISSGISLTMTREFLYAVPKLNFGDFVKNANDKWAEFVCIDNAYNRGVYGFLQRNLFTDNRERSLKTNDLNKEYDLSGFAHHIENVRAMTEAMDKETQNVYDAKLTWSDVNNFLEETRYFYKNGTPTDEEWSSMKADVKKAFDLLSAKWGDNTCSLRYDFLTLLRVEKEHLPAPYNPSPTGASWVEQVTGGNRIETNISIASSNGYKASAVKLLDNKIGDVNFGVGQGIKWPSQVYSPYVDMLSWITKPGYNNDGTVNLTKIYEDTGIKFFNLGFIQSASGVSNGKINWGWGGYAVLNENNNDNTQYAGIKKSIKEIRELGGDVTISLGGANGTPFWQTTQDVDVLFNTYKELVQGYGLTRLDLDIEGPAQNKNNNIANAKAIKKLQQATGVDIVLTLPVLPSGLTYEQLDVLEAYLSQGVDIKLVNIMTMCYGSSALLPGENYGTASLRAVDNTKNQLKDYFKKYGNIDLTDAAAYRKIGTTTSIGFESSSYP
jgi:hypothetical protein